MWNQWQEQKIQNMFQEHNECSGESLPRLLRCLLTVFATLHRQEDIWRKKFIDYTSVKQIWTNYLLLLDWSIFGCTNLPWVLLEEKKRPIGNCSCKRGRSWGRSRQSVPSAFIQEAVVMVRWKWFEWQVEVNIRRVRDLAPVISVQRRDPSVRILPKARTTQLYTRQQTNVWTIASSWLLHWTTLRASVLKPRWFKIKSLGGVSYTRCTLVLIVGKAAVGRLLLSHCCGGYIGRLTYWH